MKYHFRDVIMSKVKLTCSYYVLWERVENVWQTDRSQDWENCLKLFATENPPPSLHSNNSRYNPKINYSIIFDIFFVFLSPTS